MRRKGIGLLEHGFAVGEHGDIGLCFGGYCSVKQIIYTSERPIRWDIGTSTTTVTLGIDLATQSDVSDN